MKHNNGPLTNEEIRARLLEMGALYFDYHHEWRRAKFHQKAATFHGLIWGIIKASQLYPDCEITYDDIKCEHRSQYGPQYHNEGEGRK